MNEINNIDKKNVFKENSKSEEIISSLSEDKKKFIEKHSLIITENMLWVTLKENSFPRKICKHSLMEKGDMLALLFRINEVCFAKLNYFRSHLSLFEPYKYHYKDGFTRTELWDADFLKHQASGYIIDFRYLNSIKEIEKFRAFCMYLEGF